MLSPFSKSLHEELYEDSGTYKAKKLLTTLLPKKKYVLSAENAKYYQQLGAKIKCIHRVLSYRQEPFLESFITKVTGNNFHFCD